MNQESTGAVRSGFAGVKAVFQFNYTFYIAAAVVAIGCLILSQFLNGLLALTLIVFALGATYLAVASAGASHWIYDRSDLYRFSWLLESIASFEHIALLHAGYDEVTPLLSKAFPQTRFESYDFLKPGDLTEPSIIRARALYGTPDAEHLVPGKALPRTYDAILLLLSAHELRTPDERISLLTGIRPSLASGGSIVLVEQVRNVANFLAFGPGAFHFWSQSSWESDFDKAGLSIRKKISITPFVRAYFLR